MMRWLVACGCCLITTTVVAQEIAVSFKIPSARRAKALACLAEYQKTYGATLTAGELAQILVEQDCRAKLTAVAAEAERASATVAGSWCACGDGFKCQTEVCDDGNTTAGDGCNATCTSNETCGNGVRDPGEACDDGNVANGDGCESDCTVTPTTTTTTLAPPPTTIP